MEQHDFYVEFYEELDKAWSISLTSRSPAGRASAWRDFP